MGTDCPSAAGQTDSRRASVFLYPLIRTTTILGPGEELTACQWRVIFNYMVECTLTLDRIFASLADATRRDMLQRLRGSRQLSIGQIAAHYPLTFAGIAKHLKVLEEAGLVKKRRAGKQQIVQIVPKTIAAARTYLDQYGDLINERFDRLDALLAGRRS